MNKKYWIVVFVLVAFGIKYFQDKLSAKTALQPTTETSITSTKQSLDTTKNNLDTISQPSSTISNNTTVTNKIDYVGNVGNYTIPKKYKAYYENIDFTQEGMAIKQQLATLITDTHSPIPYTPGIWEACKVTDEDPQNSENVLLIYGWPDKDAKQNKNKRSMPKENTNNKTDNSRDQHWEREHVFAKSLAVFKPLKQKALEAITSSNYKPLKLEEIAGHDAHNLRAINGSWNSTRGNRKFIEGKGNSKAVGKEYWYPGDEWKGDVARMMMYMHIRYEANNQYTKATKVGMPIDKNNGILSDEMIDLFLKWNAEDPVSAIERKRNDYHSDKSNKYAQGNRNPFIDNPYLATQIWGGPTAENKWKNKE
ncbi:MAG: endonuclease [Flavobacteriaceae bacterium]|jgi:endonuclease I|nr:endonuclease [Flavobacteriaceae bacterium]